MLKVLNSTSEGANNVLRFHRLAPRAAAVVAENNDEIMLKVNFSRAFMGWSELNDGSFGRLDSVEDDDCEGFASFGRFMRKNLAWKGRPNGKSIWDNFANLRGGFAGTSREVRLTPTFVKFIDPSEGFHAKVGAF
ncbi:MAG: hypothetical protein ACTS6G_05100 [Candidatus Hodgkinia cicadicola]